MNFDAFTAWLALHPDWILGTIALLSFLESLLLIGLVTPGIALLFVVATLAGSARLPLWEVILVSGASATAGDVVSFYIGRHFHHHIAGLSLLQRHPQWLDRAEQFIRRYGMAGLGVGRFIGPLRPFMPMVAGTLEMPPWRFWLVELVTLGLWGGLYMAPGYAVGAAADHAENHLGSMVLVWLALWGAALLIAWMILRAVTRTDTGTQRQRLAMAWAGLCAALFGGLMALVVTGYATGFNQWAGLHWIALRTDWLDAAMIGLTGLGEFRPMLAWVVMVTIALLLGRRPGAALLWLIITNGGNQLFSGLKTLTSVVRPQWVAEPPASLSFPSGHASMALAFAGTLCVLAWPPASPRLQRALVMGAASWAFLQGTSRLYLGVHWSADVGAGWLLGGLLVAVAAFARVRLGLRPVPASHLLAATLVAWALGAVLAIVPEWSDTVARYRLAG